MPPQTSDSTEAVDGSARQKQKISSSASNIERSKEESRDSSSNEDLCRRGLGGKPVSQSLRFHKTSAYTPFEAMRDPKGQAILNKASQLSKEHPTLRAGMSLEPPQPAGGGVNYAAEAAPLVVAGDASAPFCGPIKHSFPSSESLQRKPDAARTSSGLSAPASSTDSRRASATGAAPLSRQGSGMRKASTTTSLDRQGADETDQTEKPNFKVC